MTDTLLVNFFAGPGAGKSTITANTFAELKWMGIEAEMALEFAKDLVWEERFNTLENQLYVFGKQLHRIKRLENKVDVILTDSPLLFSLIYTPEYLKKIPEFKGLVVKMFNQFNNINFYIERLKKYNPKGRMQNESEAMGFDLKVKNMLDDYKLDHHIVKGNKESVSIIVDKIVEKLNQ